MHCKLKSAKPLENFNILLSFENGETGIYDIKPLAEKYEMFKPLIQNKSFFSSFQIDPGGYGLSWNDFIDISCDELFENCKRK
ncbi:MAG: DUF2442 domain-containing protein [Ruminococcus sp.]|nr:DUF2442 domain-containing protein [Ruminococcus sp.]MCM1381876.1 DUF2442 domain-containing protein [Muribaculaceae bacterium]MCM1479218.1 DUF2442 domain-containing protein [Muribaculaceae bacterium]